MALKELASKTKRGLSQANNQHVCKGASHAQRMTLRS